mmetsp:Transcript_2249/g.5262  ORF Transcript_2249/g.5262 Transcript_2249/m.5262 type:complete len:214 (-) Transcript_2249:761-1402(-)
MANRLICLRWDALWRNYTPRHLSFLGIRRLISSIDSPQLSDHLKRTGHNPPSWHPNSDSHSRSNSKHLRNESPMHPRLLLRLSRTCFSGTPRIALSARKHCDMNTFPHLHWKRISTMTTRDPLLRQHIHSLLRKLLFHHFTSRTHTHWQNDDVVQSMCPQDRSMMSGILCLPSLCHSPCCSPYHSLCRRPYHSYLHPFHSIRPFHSMLDVHII